MNTPVDFNPLAGDYERYRVGYGEEVFAAVARRLNHDSSLAVLDLACGTGLSTVPLRSQVEGVVVGADIARELLKRAPASHREREIRYVRADAMLLPFRDRSFQAVTCAQALHWVPPAQVMPEVQRVLGPGGWFFSYWKYPAPQEPYQLLANRVLSSILNRTVESRYTLAALPDLSGFGFLDVAEEHFELRIPYTVSDYVGFMSSRRRIRDLAGEKTEEFLIRYEDALSRLHPGDGAFEELNVVSLFSGRKSPAHGRSG